MVGLYSRVTGLGLGLRLGLGFGLGNPNPNPNPNLDPNPDQALDWMFAKRLIVPGTFVRYDDWPRFNATHGPYKGTNFFGQARAHYELSEKWDVRWKLVATGAVQVVSITLTLFLTLTLALTLT